MNINNRQEKGNEITKNQDHIKRIDNYTYKVKSQNSDK